MFERMLANDSAWIKQYLKYYNIDSTLRMASLFVFGSK